MRLTKDLLRKIVYNQLTRDERAAIVADKDFPQKLCRSPLTADQRLAIIVDFYYETFEREAKQRQLAGSLKGAAMRRKTPLTVREYRNRLEHI